MYNVNIHLCSFISKFITSPWQSYPPPPPRSVLMPFQNNYTVFSHPSSSASTDVTTSKFIAKNKSSKAGQIPIKSDDPLTF